MNRELKGSIRNKVEEYLDNDDTMQEVIEEAIDSWLENNLDTVIREVLDR